MSKIQPLDDILYTVTSVKGNMTYFSEYDGDIFVGGSHASIVRQTKQNAATLGVSMVVLGLPWGLLWLWVCDMHFID